MQQQHKGVHELNVLISKKTEELENTSRMTPMYAIVEAERAELIAQRNLLLNHKANAKL